MVKISSAKLTDSELIRKLEAKVWGGEVVNKYDVPMFIKLGYVFVAKDGKKIVGVICSYLTKNNEVHVCDWVVDQKYRGQTIGLKLFQKLIKAVKGKSIVCFINSKNKTSLAAHKKLGFNFKKLSKRQDPYSRLNGGRRVLAMLNG